MRARSDLQTSFKKIQAFQSTHRRPPSFQEIADIFAYKSKNAAFLLVNKFMEKGWLSKDSKGKIALPLPHPPGIRLLGSIAAGWPSPAEEELIDTMSLDEFLIQHPEQTFLIKVSGDSMIDAGIHPGDLVLVERGRQAKHRDIVIAEVDGQWTMKYYEKHNTQIHLVSANVRYSPIIAKQSLSIAGVVTAVIRKYA